MKDIYSRAERVYVWLGGHVPGRFGGNSSVQEPFRSYGSADAALVSLATRGADVWWRRLWVIQEYATCKDVQVIIGDSIGDWDHLSKYVESAPDSLWTHALIGWISEGVEPAKEDMDSCGFCQHTGTDRREVPRNCID